ncbi:MAG: hypothetical protein PHP95_06605 [Desulfuromonadaceae bacterium]|nr:hypothetical protein [Desulfuromonadaceae bacterium]MDD2848111.1 hypothetical protein [Desulfuromonadaceae bacterium]MDD4132048.1 hypothetical protein [Desulfuromonadaceae bacterium]
MKKLISLTLVLALATVFAAGCKKKEEAPAAAPAVEAPAAAVQKSMSATTEAPAAAPAAPAEAPKH